MADDTTRIINLTEATEISDGMYLVTDASTGTRKLSLQKVLDKAGGNVADDYDATATYDVGDLCVYKGVLYECTTAITTAEAWNSAHWSRINLGDIVADIDGSIEELYEDKANESGEYDDIVAGTAKQLLSSIYTTNTQPYLYRPTPADSDRERVKRIEGLSVGWNQLAETPTSKSEVYGITRTVVENGGLNYSGTSTNSTNFSACNIGVTIPQGHKCLFYISDSLPTGCSINVSGTDKVGYRFVEFSITWINIGVIIQSGTTVDFTIYPMIFDLTTLFGSTIADYIYSLEQATEGSGVAWVKQYIDLDSYHAYSAPTIKSVEGLEAHVMRDADDNIIGNYPLDSTITLRGIPKLVDGKLVADGDWYEPSGNVTVRYGIVDLGDLNWQKSSSGNKFYVQASSVQYAVGADVKMICAKYIFDGAVYTDPYYGDDKTIRCYQRGNAQASCELYVHDEAYSDAASFKTAMSGIMLVYEKATPTTSTASPYQEVQICESGGTEEFVTDSPVPVGHVTEYPADLRKQVENIYGIPPVPEEDGEYTLHATVAEGVKTFTWESEA